LTQTAQSVLYFWSPRARTALAVPQVLLALWGAFLHRDNSTKKCGKGQI
jgi:hypothetical protein